MRVKSITVCSGSVHVSEPLTITCNWFGEVNKRDMDVCVWNTDGCGFGVGPEQDGDGFQFHSVQAFIQ